MGMLQSKRHARANSQGRRSRAPNRKTVLAALVAVAARRMSGSMAAFPTVGAFRVKALVLCRSKFERPHRTVTIERLQGILAGLPHASDGLVWCEDMPEWKRAGELPDFRVRAVAPPPLPRAFENEQMPTWRIRWWWLIFALCALVISSRDGRRMMGWASGHRRRASTHYCWNMSRDSRAEPFVWTTTRVLQGGGRITQL